MDRSVDAAASHPVAVAGTAGRAGAADFDVKFVPAKAAGAGGGSQRLVNAGPAGWQEES